LYSVTFAGLLLTFGACNRNEGVVDVDKGATQVVTVVPHSKSTSELKKFFASDSIAGNVEIQTKECLTFLQTFPYSGVRRSHLYVYAEDTHGLEFVCFFRLPSQDDIQLKITDDNTVEIRVGDEWIAELKCR
jgi:hypothetical protein